MMFISRFGDREEWIRRRLKRGALLGVTLIGLILRVGYAVAIYAPDLFSYHGGDYFTYRLLAEDILRGDLAFTNSGYLLRPPLFPLLIAALGIQPALVIAVNIALGTAMIPLTYWLARRCDLSREVALLAASIAATDPAAVKYGGGVLMAEPLAYALLACALIALSMQWKAADPKWIVIWGALSGSLIMLSALTRPGAYLLWIPMGIWIGLSRRRRRGMLAAFAFILPAVILFGLWKHHNAVYLNNGSFSAIGTWNMLYIRSASVLYQRSGVALDEIHTELAMRVEVKAGNSTGNTTARELMGIHRTPTQAQQHAMTDVALEVFLQYPWHYALSAITGFYNTVLRVNAYPGWLAIGYRCILLLTAAYGLWRLFSERRYELACVLLLPCLYFLVGTSVTTNSLIDSRASVMLTPLLAIMAAYGIMYMINRRRARSASRANVDRGL